MRRVNSVFKPEAVALVRILSRYRLTVAPVVRRELRRWHELATAIPDDELRAHALNKLRAERLTLEAAAVFACFADRRHRATATRLIVAFEVMYEYLDGVSEQRVPDILRNSRQLHSALLAGVGRDDQDTDYYRDHCASDDGGFLDRLVATCRDNFGRLPAAATVAPRLARVVTRCGEAQSRGHAVFQHGPEQLVRWSALHASGEFAWWEYAAGATASLGVHALFAAAADPTTSSFDVERIDEAYCPAIGALATLLDSVIDDEEDDEDALHRYVAYYSSPEATARGLAAIVGEANSRATLLRDPAGHKVIVAGIACFYLSAPEATRPSARPVAAAVIAEVGPIATPILAVVRHRRRHGRLGARM